MSEHNGSNFDSVGGMPLIKVNDDGGFIDPSKLSRGIDHIHQNFSIIYAELETLKNLLYQTVQESYRDHPDKEMRKFWGI